MDVPEKQRIENEIRHWESRRQQVERELTFHSSLTRMRFLSEDLMKLKRTLAALQQQHARATGSN